METGFVSIRGKVREKDEDSILVLSSTLETEGIEETRTVAVVADGMGGGELGEVASRIAVTSFRESLVNLLSKEMLDMGDAKEAMNKAFRTANLRIISYSRDHRVSWMGTTATAVFLFRDFALVGNVGDSRTFVFDSSGKLKFRTKDHSYAQELVDSGAIDEREARHDPRRNELTRALGIVEDVEPDIYERKMAKGDSILLCCDGLWEALGDTELGNMMRTRDSAQNIADNLAATANDKDGSDNISLVLLRA